MSLSRRKIRSVIFRWFLQVRISAPLRTVSFFKKKSAPRIGFQSVHIPREILEITIGRHFEVLRVIQAHINPHTCGKTIGQLWRNTDVRLAPPAVLCPTRTLAARHCTTTASTTTTNNNSNATKRRAAPVTLPSVVRVLPLRFFSKL